jgi:magnesium transporter
VRDESGVLRTSSLPLIIGELSLALKDNQKNRRAQNAALENGVATRTPSRTPPNERHLEAPILVHDYMMPSPALAEHTPEVETPKERRRGRKGKQRADRPDASATPLRISKTLSTSELDRAWWLDVANPTWEDLRAIAKVLFSYLSR